MQPSNLGAYPSYGMSMRFKVSVSGPADGANLDLGLWCGCKNLQMDLSYKPVAQGGEYLTDSLLPDKITYQPVVLERPMEKGPSAMVQKWLEQQITGWNTYPSKGNDVPSATVEITLLDYKNDDVMTWTLREARLCKWTGPALSTADSKVAIESLAITHAGFLSAGFPGSQKQAELKPELDDDGPGITLNFNPSTVTVEHISQTGGAARNNTNNDANITDTGPLSLSLPTLTFDGKDTFDNCERLLKWSILRPPPGGGESVKPSLPTLILDWGNFTVKNLGKIKVNLTKVTIVYERFDASAKPTRATVSLELKVIISKEPGQNPTSGGLPGRGGHLTVLGDTLAGIARKAYGDPAHWRRLAVANRIDDPLRVRPGSMLYLPDRAELPS
jgi:phage tail-like protein